MLRPMHGAVVVTTAERAVDALIGVLAGRGYTVIAPTVRDGAIVLDEVGGVADLPIGWSDEQEAATYRLHRNGSRSPSPTPAAAPSAPPTTEAATAASARPKTRTRPH
jgi:hypothetical protein